MNCKPRDKNYHIQNYVDAIANHKLWTSSFTTGKYFQVPTPIQWVKQKKRENLQEELKKCLYNPQKFPLILKIFWSAFCNYFQDRAKLYQHLII